MRGRRNQLLRVHWALLLAGGILLGAAGVLWSLNQQAGRTWGALLVNSFYYLSLALGALFFLAVQYLAKARWWVVLQRIPEALIAPLPWLAPLLLLVFWGGGRELYPWNNPRLVVGDSILLGKATYLDSGFFALRMLLILGAWTIFAVLFRRTSIYQDRAKTPELGLRRMGLYSALFVVTFAISVSIAGFDWLMSLEPHWFSTIFGVYTFAGVFSTGIAGLVVAVLLLREHPVFVGALNDEHLHDLGKLLFAFSSFWAYIWLSQFLLIWYGDLPEEVAHYVPRMQGGWLLFFVLNPLLNWVVPFLVLLPRAAKRNPRILLLAAAVVLAGRWMDLYLHVMPTVEAQPQLGLPELLPLIGGGAVFVALTSRALSSAPLIPRWNPHLSQSLRYHS